MLPVRSTQRVQTRLMLSVALMVGAMIAGSSGPRATQPKPPHRAKVPGTALYDPDPKHLWNRLHHAFHMRETAWDGRREVPRAETTAFDPNDLDPFSWDPDHRRGRYLLTGPAHKEALALLDEFLLKRGEKLIGDPLKRALLQRDLWTLFDWTTAPIWSWVKESERLTAGRRAFQTRLAKILPRLALSGEQIERLPDNYAAAVAAKTYPAAFNPARKTAAFLPADLFRPDGPWVLLGNVEGPALAERHVAFVDGRSAFLVYLRLPGGRPHTLKYVKQLREWQAKGVRDGFPEFPPETQTALVRRTLLIDDRGELRPTPLTELVQLRVIHDPANLKAGKLGSQTFLEFRLRRARLMAGTAGGLQAVPDNEGEWDRLTQLGGGFGMVQPIMASCRHCHFPPGLLGMNSFERSAFRPSKGRWFPTTLAAEERRVAAWKWERYSWGLLKGLNRPPQRQ